MQKYLLPATRDHLNCEIRLVKYIAWVFGIWRMAVLLMSNHQINFAFA